VRFVMNIKDTSSSSLYLSFPISLMHSPYSPVGNFHESQLLLSDQRDSEIFPE
jgi:hypothetical protein